MIFFNSNQLSNPEIVSASKGILHKKNGESLFDTWLGSGSLIFGHDCVNHSICVDMLPNGLPISEEFLGLVKQLVNFRVGGMGFQTSGSAAITRAIRLARSITRRSKVAVVGKFWHGSENEFLFRQDKDQISIGVPSAHQSEIVWFETVSDFLRAINKETFAAILIEPFQGADPSVSMLNAISTKDRDELRGAGVLLICDEIITGFRERYGSCSASRASNPDIVVFGKAIGLGFPVGIVLVNEYTLSNTKVYPFWGGTFASSPTQVTRVHESLRRLKSLDYTKLQSNHNALIEIFQKVSLKYDYEIRTGCMFSRVLSSFKSTESRGFLSAEVGFSELRLELEKMGIFLASNALVFPSIYNLND